MTVIDKRSEPRMPFRAMKIGETFMYDHELYMKMSIMQSPAGRTVNAIMLGLGNDVRFCDDELVTPVKCELHIVD